MIVTQFYTVYESSRATRKMLFFSCPTTKPDAGFLLLLLAESALFEINLPASVNFSMLEFRVSNSKRTNYDWSCTTPMLEESLCT